MEESCWTAESQQTPKTFTDPKGGEFKLLKDPEGVLGTQIVDVARLSTHVYCSESCYVQSMPPSIQEEQLQDFLTFCAMRNAISDLRPVMSTQMSFEVLIEKNERDGDQAKAEWAQVLRHMSQHTKTPIYDILAMKDL